MPDFKLIDVEAMPYLYHEGTSGMEPGGIGAAMGGCFNAVWGFMQANGVQTTGKALAVYYTYDPEQVTFRAGFSVAPDAAGKAKGPVKFDVTPAGQVLYFRHIGPYSTLRDSYGQMMAYMEKEGLTLGAPAWEVYLNDPKLTPEEELITDAFVSLG